MSTNRKRRKRQLRRQIKQRDRETIVLSRKVAKRLLGKIEPIKATGRE